MKPETAVKQLKELEKQGKQKKELRLAAESWNSDFQILVSTIMSARTRDEVTIPVAEKLFMIYPTAKKLTNANINDIKRIINPVNFYNNKAKNIINCAKSIVKNHKGNVPHNFDLLIKLPGVGRKTANVFLNEIGEDAIGIDTHVGYISKKLGWTSGKNQEQIEKNLKELFPKKYWRIVNSTLVRFGKTHTSRREKDMILEKIGKIK